MSTSVIALVKQAEMLSAAETLELIMALLQRARNTIDTPQAKMNWSEIRGLCQYPIFGEDAQVAINRLREEWNDREQIYTPHG